MGQSRSALGLFVVGLGTLVVPLDSAVNIAFPSITRAFAIEVQDIRWVVIAYVLTHSSLLLICGKLGDLLGYRRIFRLGLLVSAAAFVACSLATTFSALLLGRILQGIGIALTLSCAPALATSLYLEGDRTRVLGIYASMTAAGAALGPVIGGLLVERWGWAAVFWARTPLVLTALALSWLLPAGTRLGSARDLDLLGGCLLVTCISALLLAIAAPSTALGLALPLGLAILAMTAFIAFVRHERGHPEPIIRPSLFADLDFTIMNAVSIAVNFATFSIMLLVPYYLVRSADLGAATGGLVLALAPGGTVVGAWIAGRFGRSLGVGRLALAGVVLATVGLACISLWSAQTAIWMTAVSLIVQGAGVGLFQVAYTDLVTSTLPVRDRGVAGSLTMVTRTIGVVGGASGHAAVHRHFELMALAAGAPAAAAFLAGFQSTFLVVSVALAAVLALTFARPAVWRTGART